MVKVTIDYSKCVRDAANICVELCPVSVFGFKRSKTPEVVNPENCTMCRTCQVNCPGQAIQIIP